MCVFSVIGPDCGITQLMGYLKIINRLLRIILKLKRQNNLIQGNKLNLNDKLKFTYY